MKCVQLLFFLFFSFAGIENKAQALPDLLLQVEKRYTQAATLTADFSQSVDNPVLGKKKVSFGKLFVKRPSKIRWETIQPEPSLFVSDGQNSWFYTPPFEAGERGQAIERKSAEVGSKLTHALLAGSFSDVKEMKIVVQSNSTFLLLPKAGTAGTVVQVALQIDPNQKLIQKVTLEHQGGNQTEITLSRVELASPLQEELFHFQIPPNTDQID